VTPEPPDISVIVSDRRWRGLGAGLAERLAGAAVRAGATGDVAVNLADDALLRRLNRDFRGRDRPTNVLSFAMNEAGYLGDIALSYDRVVAEAGLDSKAPADHAIHLVVHGVLHLLGYDHEDDGDAVIMEERERAVMAELGLPDPYGNAQAALNHE